MWYIQLCTYYIHSNIPVQKKHVNDCSSIGGEPHRRRWLNAASRAIPYVNDQQRHRSRSNNQKQMYAQQDGTPCKHSFLFEGHCHGYGWWTSHGWVSPLLGHQGSRVLVGPQWDFTPAIQCYEKMPVCGHFVHFCSYSWTEAWCVHDQRNSTHIVFHTSLEFVSYNYTFTWHCRYVKSKKNTSNY